MWILLFWLSLNDSLGCEGNNSKCWCSWLWVKFEGTDVDEGENLSVIASLNKSGLETWTPLLRVPKPDAWLELELLEIVSLFVVFETVLEFEAAAAMPNDNAEVKEVRECTEEFWREEGDNPNAEFESDAEGEVMDHGLCNIVLILSIFEEFRLVDKSDISKMCSSLSLSNILEISLMLLLLLLAEKLWPPRVFI